MKRKQWSNPKHGKGPFTSFYQVDEAGERVFVLVRKNKNGTYRRITFESWQAAHALGWKKV